jgi:hypothetical protein
MALLLEPPHMCAQGLRGRQHLVGLGQQLPDGRVFGRQDAGAGLTRGVEQCLGERSQPTADVQPAKPAVALAKDERDGAGGSLFDPWVSLQPQLPVGQRRALIQVSHRPVLQDAARGAPHRTHVVVLSLRGEDLRAVGTEHRGVDDDGGDAVQAAVRRRVERHDAAVREPAGHGCGERLASEPGGAGDRNQDGVRGAPWLLGQEEDAGRADHRAGAELVGPGFERALGQRAGTRTPGRRPVEERLRRAVQLRLATLPHRPPRQHLRHQLGAVERVHHGSERPL